MSDSDVQPKKKRAGRKSAEPVRPPEQFLELAELLDYVGQVIARGVPGGAMPLA